MRSSAKSMSGWRAGREPVAIRIAAPFTRLAPSLPAISTVCGSTKLATPCRQVTPWRARLSRMRCDSEATMVALRDIRPSSVAEGSSSTATPYISRERYPDRYIAVSRSVLLGRVPVCVPAPPGCAARSVATTRLPKYAACAAAFSPAGPTPITMRSKSSISLDFTWTPHRASWLGSGVLAVLDHLHAVHEDVLHADRIGLRLLVGRRVGDGRGIEDDDVGIHPFLDQAAALEPEIARRQPGHPAHGLLQRYHLVLAHVLAEQAGEVAVRTRMRRFPQEDALGRHRGAVGADRNPQALELLRQVLLAHAEKDRAHARTVLEHQVEEGVDLVHAALLRDVGEHPADQRAQLLRAEIDEHRRGHRPVRAYLARDAGAFGAILQALEERLVAAAVRPGRNLRAEPGRAGGIHVHVGSHLGAALARFVHERQRAIHLVPVRLARGLDLVDLRRDAGLAADADQLLDRLDEALAFVAHVRRVLALVFRRFPAELDELGRLRVRARRIDQRRADAERARLHLASH